jgi:predicted alpha/beta hydrolase family esterase
MKTIILPGYSEHNRQWAEGIAKELSASGLLTTVHNWLHWKSTQVELNITSGAMAKSGMSLKVEMERVFKEISNEKVNIIAKSVGVYVALNLIPKISDQINKVILCGIASVASSDRHDLVETLTSKIPLSNILCIQNENDKFVPFAEAQEFYHSVNPKLKVVSMPRSDHNYPYPHDFQKFLKR